MTELTAFIGDNILQRPVAECTGLSEDYSLTLDISVQELNAPSSSLSLNSDAAPAPLMLRDSLRQYGLALESAKVDVNVLVVDAITKPTPN